MKISGWLNDGIIYAAQKLLESQSKGKISGWQSTQCCKREGLFAIVPQSSRFVQILHVDSCHWVTTSNVQSGEPHKDNVSIYDSGRVTTFSADVTTCAQAKRAHLIYF